MGCGGSTITADGTIAPGKGEAILELSKQDYDYIWIWDAEAKKVELQIKTIEDPKNIKDAKWETIKTGNNGPGIHDVKVKPAILQQRWIVDTGAGGLRILYPGQTTPDLCKKIHAQHKKDETKFPKVMTKAASKKEGHPYNDNPDKAKSDCDALEALVTPHQMSDDMTGLKDALINLEDFMPGNSANVNASLKKGLGTFVCLTEGEEGKLEVTLKEKAQIAAEKAAEPSLLTQAANKKEEVLNTVVKSLVGGICKAMGTTQQDLLPDLQGNLDAANGKKPLTESETYNKVNCWKEKVGAAEKQSEEEVKEARLKKLKEQVEADKKVEAEVKEKDKDMKSMIAAAKERLQARLDYAKNATKPADESALKNGTAVLAKWKVYGYYEGKVNGSVKTVDGKKVVNIQFNDGDTDDVEIKYVALDQAAKCTDDDLQVGQKVRAKFFGDKVYENGVINAKNADGTYQVRFCPIYTDDTVKLDDIKPLHDVSNISSQGFIIPKSFYNCTFTWLQADEDLDIDLRLWREGNEDADRVTSHKLASFKKKRTMKDGSEGDSIHGGYKVEIPIWNFRSYCYNFKIGDQYFVDFQKEVGEKGYRTFRIDVR